MPIDMLYRLRQDSTSSAVSCWQTIAYIASIASIASRLAFWPHKQLIR